MRKIARSLKFKILLAVVGILLSGILLETYIWVRNTIRQTRQTTIDSLSASMSVANQNFEAAMKDMERIIALAGSTNIESISVRDYLQVMSPGKRSTDQEKLKAQREAAQFLLGLCRFQFYLKGAAINDLNGHQQSYGIIMNNKDLREQEWMLQFLAGEEDQKIISPHESYSGGKASGTLVFSLLRKIKSSNGTIGIILVDVDYNMLRDFYSLQGLEGSQIYITEEQEGRVLFPQGTDLRKNEEAMIEVEMEMPVVDWTVHALVPQKSIISSSMHILRTILLMTILLDIGLCAAIGVVVFYMTKELSMFADAVKKVSGDNLELAVEIRSQDEVGELYKQTNRMLKRIRELIDEIQNAEDAKRELEILALQEQINPHFLYNTLNTITYLAQIRGIKNIENVSGALSDMLHLALGPEKYITVKREMEYLRQYLDIMEYKYSGKFIPSFEVEEDADACMVPKMILQPLVENSLKHGIATLSRPGYVRINASVKDGVLRISVWDNGKGMEEDTLNKINQIPSGTEMKTGTSIGVYNVRNRVYLLYGEQGYFHMSSTADEYTLAEIEIPAVLQEEGEP